MVLPALERFYFNCSWNSVVLMRDVASPQLMSALLKGNPPLTGCLCHLFSSFQRLSSLQGPLQGTGKPSLLSAHGPVLLPWKEMRSCSFSPKQRWESSKRPWNGAPGTKCDRGDCFKEPGQHGCSQCWAWRGQSTHQEPETPSTITGEN